MSTANQAPSMNQEIFKMGLDTATVSAYLLCCGLADAQTPLTMDNIRDRWVGTENELSAGLETLRERGIIRVISTADDGQETIHVCEVDQWQQPPTP